MADSEYDYVSASEPVIESTPAAPKAPLDLSHHFSRVTAARQVSAVKGFYKFFAIPGIGNLAGGVYIS